MTTKKTNAEKATQFPLYYSHYASGKPVYGKWLQTLEIHFKEDLRSIGLENKFIELWSY